MRGMNPTGDCILVLEMQSSLPPLPMSPSQEDAMEVDVPEAPGKGHGMDTDTFCSELEACTFT